MRPQAQLKSSKEQWIGVALKAAIFSRKPNMFGIIQ
jgi:hypothetical protein